MLNDFVKSVLLLAIALLVVATLDEDDERGLALVAKFAKYAYHVCRNVLPFMLWLRGF